MIGYINAFHLMAFAALAAIPLAVFMRRVQGEGSPVPPRLRGGSHPIP